MEQPTQDNPIVILSITIHKANDLPKADTVGKIDPYFKIKWNSILGGKDQKGKTKVIDCDYDPIFENCFAVEAPSAQGIPSGVFELQLWDKDTVGKDDFVGELKVPVTQKISGQRHDINIKKGFKNRKGKTANVTVSIGWIVSYDALKSRIRAINPTAYFIDLDVYEQKIYVPLGTFLPAEVILGIEYSPMNKKVDLKIYETKPYFEKLDFLLELGYTIPGVSYQVKRQVFHSYYEHFIPGPNGTKLRYYAETKMSDIPLYFDFSKIAIFCSTIKRECEINLDAIVVNHGWKGTLTYEAAKKCLMKAFYDDKTKTVFLLEEFGAVMIDWDSSNADVSFGIYDTAAAQNLISDVVLTGNPTRLFQYYATPRPTSKAQVIMKVKLDDMPHLTPFKDINLYIYKRIQTYATTFIQHVPLL